MNLTVTFDGSFEGFINIIYAHYYQKLRPDLIFSEDQVQQSLDTEYVHVETDMDKALRVLNAIRRDLSMDVLDTVYSAYLAEEKNYLDMYRYMVLAFKVGAGVNSHKQVDYVMETLRTAGYVNKEAHLLKGFCRFAETKSGVFYASITPVNFVLPILAEHFKDRLMNQAWIIHDVKRGVAVVYDGNDYVMRQVPKQVMADIADVNDQYQALWQTFHKSIGIKERENYKLQRSLLPLRFRRNMLEFNPLTKSTSVTLSSLE